MRSLALLVATLLAAAVTGGAAPAAFDPAPAQPLLYAVSAQHSLDHDFPSPSISYLLLDARTGTVLASRWNHPEAPIPFGSLLKPFTALAYGERHEYRFPTHFCHGTPDRCWLPRGHGRIELISAIAASCNSYFRMLTADLTSTHVSSVAASFGLQPPPLGLSGQSLAGIGAEWAISPLSLARAYLELARRRDQPGVREIVAGMAAAAQWGTAAEVDRELQFSRALAKTGTAVCTHTPHAPGDGFALALLPADQPRLLLLVRLHGVPGAHAAQTAGQMLRRLED